MSESKPSALRISSYSTVRVIDTSAYLVLGYFDAEHLLVRESQLVEHKHVAVVLFLNFLARFSEYTGDSSTVCELVAFTSFLSVSFTRTSAMSYAIFVLILKGVVDEEIIAYRIDVVDNRLHAVGLRHHLIVFSSAAIYRPRHNGPSPTAALIPPD